MAAKIFVIVGDITQEKVDAVVNAANCELTGGSGVNGAIHKAGGPEIYRFCEELRATKYPDGLPSGQSAITPGLHCRPSGCRRVSINKTFYRLVGRPI